MPEAYSFFRCTITYELKKRIGLRHQAWQAAGARLFVSQGFFKELELDDNDPIAGLEQAVAERPDDARAIVALANAYWLSGRGPEVVGELASRAIAADPDNRAGWHLWALAESDPRNRVARWQQVSERFPSDDLARANVADNAAALAGAEHDHDALDLAIATYEQLLAKAEHRAQREALDAALRNLRGWRF